MELVPSTRVIHTTGGDITVSYKKNETTPSLLTIRFRNHAHIVEEPGPVVNLQWLQPLLEENIYAPTVEAIITDLRAIVTEMLQQAQTNRETMHILGAAVIDDMMRSTLPSSVYPPIDQT